MKRLLNLSTHSHDLGLFENDWENARRMLGEYGFDAYELYPVDPYDYAQIPSELIAGIHLRFFVIIEPLWNENRESLLRIFGDMETVEHFYGGLDRQAMIDVYRAQLNLAHRLGCEYFVFHAAHCELEHVFDWEFPWRCEDILDLSAEIMNEVTRETDYEGWILFENLWWPGSFRCLVPSEIERLLSQVEHPRAGICLDTGHILNTNQSLATEAEGIDYLLSTVNGLGSLSEAVKGVHLTRSLSGEYVRASRSTSEPYAEADTFWDRLGIAREHVYKIDQHEGFEDSRIGELFDLISPEFLTFEFTFRGMDEWRRKIEVQRRALAQFFD